MTSLFDSRLVKPVLRGLSSSIYAVQHALMKVAIAFSLKLCLFTARVLMGSAERRQAGSL
ncbi:MAG: hypothetical protein AAFR58_22835 [Cyanobacteria bacterium J06627_28]